MSKRLLKILVLVLLLADFSYSFMQYYNSQLDGDLPNSINPSPDIQNVFDSPLGLDVALKREKYANPNRFFCHWSIDQYMTHVPVLLQSFTTSINSVYVAIGIGKLLFHFLILYFLALLITGRTKLPDLNVLLIMLLLTPLFQANGLQHHMGVVHKSITYFFFYTFPIALLLLYFMPFIMRSYHVIKKWDTPVIRIIWPFLAIIVSLSGALNPGISLVMALLIVLHFLTRNYTTYEHHSFFSRLLAAIKKIPGRYYFYLLPIVLLSIYSLLVGTANTNTIAHEKPLSELYTRLFEGIFKEFLFKPGFYILLALLIMNYLIIYFNYRKEGKDKVRSVFLWLSLFIIIYILLLPLGGFRSYRPLIIRGDTAIPVTISFIFMFGYSTWFLINRINVRKQIWYYPVIIAALLFYTISDKPHFDKNDCERKGLEQIAASEEKVIGLDLPCSVFAWARFEEPTPSMSKIKVLKKWNIVQKNKKYFHIKKQKKKK